MNTEGERALAKATAVGLGGSSRAFVIMLVVLYTIMFALVSGHAMALSPVEQLKDPALESRARALSAELRCLVCQNQSIDDSDAPLAKDLRLLVRERLVAGDSNDEVIEFLVARYGDFVLLKPPLRWNTLLLWLTPLLVLIPTIIFIWRAVSTRTARPLRTGLTQDEERRLKVLVAEDATTRDRGDVAPS